MAHAGARTQAHYSAPTAHAAQSAQTSSTAASGACTGVSTCLCAERRARLAGRSRRDPSAPRRCQFSRCAYYVILRTAEIYNLLAK